MFLCVSVPLAVVVRVNPGRVEAHASKAHTLFVRGVNRAIALTRQPCRAEKFFRGNSREAVKARPTLAGLPQGHKGV